MMKPLQIIKSSIVRPQHDPDWKSEIPKRMKMRAPRIWRMAQVAVQRLLNNCDIQPNSIIAGTALGALDETIKYLDGTFKDGFGSPRNFIASVHNSMAGTLAMNFKIKGPNLTVCDGQNSFSSAIRTASLLTDNDLPAIILIIDEKTELLTTLQPHFSDECKKYLSETWEEAAIAFLVDKKVVPKKPYMQASGPQSVFSSNAQEVCVKLLKSDNTGGTLLPLPETSDSFLKPAIKAYEILSTPLLGNHCIGSYSPTAQAAAIVSLCV